MDTSTILAAARPCALSAPLAVNTMPKHNALAHTAATRRWCCEHPRPSFVPPNSANTIAQRRQGTRYGPAFRVPPEEDELPSFWGDLCYDFDTPPSLCHAVSPKRRVVAKYDDDAQDSHAAPHRRRCRLPATPNSWKRCLRAPFEASPRTCVPQHPRRLTSSAAHAVICVLRLVRSLVSFRLPNAQPPLHDGQKPPFTAPVLQGLNSNAVMAMLLHERTATFLRPFFQLHRRPFDDFEFANMLPP